MAFKLSSLIFLQFSQFVTCLIYLANIFLLIILITPFHNFADDNSSSNNATTVNSLNPRLESECKVAINWFHENKMIVNRDEFQTIVFGRCKSNKNEAKFVTGSEEIQTVSSFLNDRQ